MIRKIISGGQRGADRGGLEAAHDLGIARGGYAPGGWKSEDGQIPEWYRHGMQEMPGAGYRVRTAANVKWSDGTLIISLGELAAESGSMLTANLARRIGKPMIHMTIDRLESTIGRTIVLEWLVRKNIKTLNIAGPRESRYPGIQAATRAALVELLTSAPRT